MRQRTFVAVTVVAVALCAASTATAGINRWTSHGPPDVPTSIAVDPNSPWTVYAATDGRLFKTVYAAASPEEGPNGVWKTTDGGESWTLLLEKSASVVALDRAHPDVVYAGGEGVYRSANGGATWTPLTGTEDWAVRGIAIDPRRPSRLFASAYGKGVFASEDGGTTWSGLSTGLPHRGVGQLVIDRLGRTLHVITRYYGVEERATGVFSYTILQATRGADRLVGTPGRDTIYARAGDDRIRALAGDDLIAGGRGDDRLGPGDGNDRVRGGPGSDVIRVRDGKRDFVVCGNGFDRVGADDVDAVAADCERVRARSLQAPPPISLVSKAGSQRAAQGSFCVLIIHDDGTGVGLCADTVDPEPRRLSIVRPGERVTIRLRGATFAKGGVSVHPRGCEDRVRWRFRLTGPTTHWTVPRISRPEKRFELDVEARFRTADGRSGSTWGTLGLLVSKTRARDVIPAGDSLACGQLAP